MKISKPSRVNGTLLEDPEIRFTPGGMPVCTMLVETDDGNHQYWQAWGALAQRCADYQAPNALTRGSKLSLQGIAKTQQWTDSEGTEHSRDVYTADSVTW